MEYFHSNKLLDRLQDCWDPISEEQLAELEADLGFEYPQDYRQFLLRFNAGDWSHAVKCRLREPAALLNELAIQCNLGIIADNRFQYASIWETACVYSDRVRESLVPIMMTWADPVFIDLAPESYGRIWYWSREVHNGRQLFEVCDGFEEFLASLVPDDDFETFTEDIPVFQSIERGDHDAVTQYLTDAHDLHCRNRKGLTLLVCAVRNSWPRIAQMLLAAGADPNAVDLKLRPPLYHAIRGQSLDSVKVLLSFGADLSYCTPKGRNLAQVAKHYGCHRILYYLERLMP